ncbi:MAG: HAD family hydrolase [Bryobacteraceae bacterium]|jgi:putative hydrolase of the HAD superfamily
MAERQHLIFDADDTLWENNVYFEQAFDEFVEFLAHSTLAPAEVRGVLDEIELVNRDIHGYGARNFGCNLRQCYQRLAEREISAADLDRVMSFAERILEQPLELIEGVPETIACLAERHELILFTKGHPEEQAYKIEVSGLAPHFRHTAIVKEKDAGSFRALVEECGLAGDRTWMVGNSPRSDINPALEIGLGAVYIPHARTWSLESEEIRDGGGRLLVLERFADLREHF